MGEPSLRENSITAREDSNLSHNIAESTATISMVPFLPFFQCSRHHVPLFIAVFCMQCCTNNAVSKPWRI